MNNGELYIGLMSGTSADGVDAALIEIFNDSIHLVDFIEHPLPSKISAQLIELNQQTSISFEGLAKLNYEVAQQFYQAAAKLIKKHKLAPESLSAIGSHGQTIYHAPDIPMTLQIGHPAFIAKQTAVTTVADFRVDDMALGGQGAPFAPAFHKYLFSSESTQLAVNIGGIANLSLIPPANSNQPAIGWDTGPGNSIMDQLSQQKFDQAFDRDGSIAEKGQVQSQLLQQLLLHPFFNQSGPKSTGRESFNLNWVKKVVNELKLEISVGDLMSTLSELTATSIAQQVKTLDLNEASKTNIWIVGGGAYNRNLISRIQQHLPNHKVASSIEKEINPNAVEAMMCAWLAQQRINNRPVKLSAVTGASRDAVLGGIWHP